MRAWFAFLLGAVVCVLALSYVEMRKEPSGLLVLDASSTQPGMLKVLYTKDGVLTDPGWSLAFPKGGTHQSASFPLSAGRYELVGLKPLIEAGGRVTISKLKIISGAGVSDISAGNFVTINQLDKISSQNGEIVIAPAQGANDPFGVFANLQEIVSIRSFALTSMLWIASGKLGLIAVFMALIYGLSGNLPFARGGPNEARPEPGRSQWLGFLAIGLIILYLRNAHSIFVPVLYAEDGSWSAGLINRGFLDMLFNARGDYFVFGNVLLMALAQLCNAIFFGHNLTYLPHFVSFISMLFYAALAVAPLILLRGVLRIEARLLLWLLVLLVPLGDSSYEVLGRLSNIGFVFLFLAFCLLIWRRYSLRDGSRKQVVATDVMLFLCANTNPLCYPLIAVAFGAEAWQHWRTCGHSGIFDWLKKFLDRFSTRSAIALLTMLFLTGLWILLRDRGDYSFLAGNIALSNIPEMIVARSFLYPIIFPVYSHFNNMTSSLLLLITIIMLAWLTKGVKREKLILISAAAVLVVSTVLTIASRPGLSAMLDHYQTSNLDRYYFGLTMFVYLVLASALSAGFGANNNSFRRVFGNLFAGGLIALYLGNGTFLFEFAKPRFEVLPTLTFYDEIKKAYENGGEGGPNGMRYKVALHPAPWVTHFPADYVITTVNGTRYTPPFAITYLQSKVPIMQLNDVAHKYDEKVVHKTAGRGREDGWFYVTGGVRSWIPDGSWLKQKNLSTADVIEITSEDFDAIPDSGVPVK